MEFLEPTLAFFRKIYEHGDVWMHPIAATGVLGLGIVSYRLTMMIFVYNINGKRFTDQVMKLVISGQFDRAVKFCNSRGFSILPKILRAGLTRRSQGAEVIETAMEEQALLHLPKTTKYIDFVGTLANLATLFGLLATVHGMIIGFEAVAGATADKRAEMLSQAIAIALNGTLFGLINALPLFFCHGIMVTFSDKISADVEYGAKTLHNALTIGTSLPQNMGARSFANEERTRGTGTGARPLAPGEATQAQAAPPQPTTNTVPGGPNRIRRTG